MNHFLASIQHEPILIGVGSENWFESCLAEASKAFGAVSEKLEAPQLGEAMSSDGFWFAPDDWRATYRPYSVKNGILTIAVKGALLNDFPWQFGNYATGYRYIAEAMKRGVDDSEVKGIALYIDSPGGVVAGNFDLVDSIHEARGSKPIWAFAANYACSAAYSIASAADTITATRSSSVGSIGVLMTHVDVSSSLEQQGVKITYVFAGKHKVDGNSTEPLPDDVRKRYQARTEKLYSEFVGIVARNRAMDEQAVRDTEALVYDAQEALGVGLVDQIGPIDSEISAFVAFINTKEDDNMAEHQAQFTQTDLDAAKAEGFAAGQTKGSSDAVARINAIMDSDAGKARPKAALGMALKMSVGADEAIGFLATLPEEKSETMQAPAPTQPAAGAPAGAFEAAMTQSQPAALAPGNAQQKTQEQMDADLIGGFGLPGFKQNK